MSIQDEIVDRVARGMLWPLLPLVPGVSPIRALFVGEALQKVLDSPEGDDEWERRVGELRADLERFVVTPEITPKYLFLLYPARDYVWEIRSVAHDPSIRVLGRFAERDVLVATNHALRSDLGGWQSRAWKEVKRLALAIWRTLFFSEKALETRDINQVVSGAMSGDYFKDRD